MHLPRRMSEYRVQIADGFDRVCTWNILKVIPLCMLWLWIALLLERYGEDSRQVTAATALRRRLALSYRYGRTLDVAGERIASSLRSRGAPDHAIFLLFWSGKLQCKNGQVVTTHPRVDRHLEFLFRVAVASGTLYMVSLLAAIDMTDQREKLALILIPAMMVIHAWDLLFFRASQEFERWCPDIPFE